MKEAGLVKPIRRLLGQKRGRPEESLGLSEKGFRALQEKGILKSSLSYDVVAGEALHCHDHQLLMNWFRIHLEQVPRVRPQCSFKIFTDSSPFLPLGPDMQQVLAEYVPTNTTNKGKTKFTPDAVFTSKDSNTGTSLLFFLEVDMGTESLARPDKRPGDVREKILNYQMYFRTEKYKRYEELWDCHFHGFRLLFLAHTHERLSALCRLVEQMPPSDFIWLTELNRMFSSGVADKIWVRGGKPHLPDESILGSLHCHTPLLHTK